MNSGNWMSHITVFSRSVCLTKPCTEIVQLLRLDSFLKIKNTVEGSQSSEHTPQYSQLPPVLNQGDSDVQRESGIIE